MPWFRVSGQRSSRECGVVRIDHPLDFNNLREWVQMSCFFHNLNYFAAQWFTMSCGFLERFKKFSKDFDTRIVRSVPV